MSDLSPYEEQEIQRANDSGRPPLVFVHGLWLLANSWDHWRSFFERYGWITLAPVWPDDPDTVDEARRRPEVFANKHLKQITDHFAGVIGRLRLTPALIGHSFGGLIVQQLAGKGLASATVAVDPAPFRGVLPLPFSALKSALPVLGNPANYSRAVALSFEQFRYAFANAVGEDEARQLYDSYSVAGSGAPLFSAATANLNPSTEARVDSTNPKRGPLLILSGEKDYTVPWSMARAAYQRQKRNLAVTELRQMAGRGHSLTIDGGWREVAEAALSFLDRYRPSAVGPEVQPQA